MIMDLEMPSWWSSFVSHDFHFFLVPTVLLQRISWRTQRVE